MIEQASFIYSAVVKAFKKQAKHLKMKEKQIHAIMNQKERQLDLNNNEQYITKKNKKLKIKEKQIYAIMNQKERQLDLNNNEQYITNKTTEDQGKTNIWYYESKRKTTGLK